MDHPKFKPNQNFAENFLYFPEKTRPTKISYTFSKNPTQPKFLIISPKNQLSKSAWRKRQLGQPNFLYFEWTDNLNLFLDIHNKFLFFSNFVIIFLYSTSLCFLSLERFLHCSWPYPRFFILSSSVRFWSLTLLAENVKASLRCFSN